MAYIGVAGDGMGAGQHCLTAADTEGEQGDQIFVTYPPGFAIHSALKEGCRKCGFEANIRMTSPQPNVLFAVVEQNLGIAMLALPPTLQEVSSDVVCIPLDESELSFSTVAVKLSNQYHQLAVEHFWNFIKEHTLTGAQ